MDDGQFDSISIAAVVAAAARIRRPKHTTHCRKIQSVIFSWMSANFLTEFYIVSISVWWRSRMPSSSELLHHKHTGCRGTGLKSIRTTKFSNMKFMILIVFGVSCFQSFVTLFFFVLSLVAVKISTKVKLTVSPQLYIRVVGSTVFRSHKTCWFLQFYLRCKRSFAKKRGKCAAAHSAR